MTITSALSAHLIAAPGSSGGAPSLVSYAGLGIAVVSAVAAFSNYLRGHLRDRRKDAEEYAAKVAAWTGPDTGQGPGNLYRFDSVVVHNGSDQPVFNTVVVLRTIEAGELPGETDVVNLPVGLIPPGEAVQREIGVPVVQELFQRPVTVSFEDARGQRWERDEVGQLRRRERVKATGIKARSRRNDDGSTGPALPEPGALERLRQKSR
ncbi:hypothetical protein [Kitasatospora sp. CB01950]|uniref:hypothetical protein n=1 Tax=Kitasatospora sp. CB01950 TaxID=1703930 RepID=UPI0009401D58|nr:hypothetical protein [Kitasatospora sp. CB01950]OKI95119.1 hypothetical protein AMK19_33180 [Kitasatospora sp. CB01950]